MPLFDYQCEDCNALIEHFTHSSELETIDCPNCNAKAYKSDKVYPPATFAFQGTGFYATDYK